MKTENRFAAFVDRFVSYLKDPNAKNQAAVYGTRGSEQAARAAIERSVRHQQHMAVRRNGRGLPVGIGPHQLRAAKRVKNSIVNNPDVVIGETRLHAAETVLEAIKRTATARAQRPRPSKLARRMAALR
jgi:NADPH-dependent glutamate synthase beta subunit-like oxidoreductase